MCNTLLHSTIGIGKNLDPCFVEMRKSDLWFLSMAVGLVLLALSAADAALRSRMADTRLARSAALVARLGLTDPVLFTEARYTRHLSQSDRHSAFQDHPMALEHFPSGALVAPPH